MAISPHNTPEGVNEPGLPPHPLLRGGRIPTDPAAFALYLAGRRKEAEALADALIAALDALDNDPDLEETADDELTGDEAEPTLGAPEKASLFDWPGGYRERVKPGLSRHRFDQRHWADGHTAPCWDDGDREVVDEDGGDINDVAQDEDELDDDPSANEASLGATACIDQNGAGWYSGTTFNYDVELDRSDFEPSLGAPEATWGPACLHYLGRQHDRNGDQTRWSVGGSLDLEDQDEDGTEIDGGEWCPAEASGIGDIDGVAEQWGASVAGYAHV